MWFYSKGGMQLGPVPEVELVSKLRSGKVRPTDLVWREGMADWLPSRSVAELQIQQVAPKTPGTGGSVPLPQPPAYTERYIEDLVPTFMWQSVVALVLGLFSICFIGMPFAIVGIVFASKVEGLRVQGRIFEAVTASKSAKLWMWLSLGFTLVSLVVAGGMLLAGQLSL